MKHLLIIGWLCLASLTLGVKLPSIFTKCNWKQTDFQECLTKAVENAIRQMNRPMKQVGLLSLEPLEVPTMSIGAGSQLVATEQNFYNVKLSGFNETTCAKAEFAFEEKALKLDCIVPHFRMEFEYELQGQVLMIGLNANGTGWAVFQEDRFEVTFQLGEYEKRGKQYYNVVSQELTMQPKDIDFDLKSLFGGDEEAAARATRLFRNNILDIYDDIKSGYEVAFGRIFGSIFDRLLTKVPVADLFGKV